jgi:ketosteroid isomerase-like protein
MKADSLTEIEVMDVLNKFADFYARRDMDCLISLIATDSDVVLFGMGPDEKRIGLNEMKIQFESDWSEFEAASIRFNWISISAVGDAAWVAADTLFKMTVEGNNLLFPCFLTMVLAKNRGNWFIVHVHYSAPAIELPHFDAMQQLCQL